MPLEAIVAPHTDDHYKKFLFHLTIFTMFSLNFVAMDLTEKQSAQEPRRPDDRQNVKHHESPFLGFRSEYTFDAKNAATMAEFATK